MTTRPSSEAREGHLVERAKSSTVEAMNRHVDPEARTKPWVLSALLTSVVLACGGQVGHDVAQSPGVTPARAPSASLSSASEPPSSTSMGPATTTTALADGSGGQGSKLPETRTAASPSAKVTVTPKAPHAHDAGRGPADIGAIVVAHRDEARACYDRALADHPGIEGDLVILWTIDPKGSVTRTATDSSRSQITEPAVVTCVTDIIERIQFARSPGGFETNASYPFNFHPRRVKQPQ